MVYFQIETQGRKEELFTSIKDITYKMINVLFYRVLRSHANAWNRIKRKEYAHIINIGHMIQMPFHPLNADFYLIL